MVSTILVTHDQREAFAIADRIAIMEKGRIAQIGTPEDVYRNPQSSSVLRFLGTTNRLSGTLTGTSEKTVVVIAPGIAFSPAVPPVDVGDGDVLVDLRAEDIAISTEPTVIHRTDPGTVALRTFLGAQERIVVGFGSYQVVVDRPAQLSRASIPFYPGQKVYFDFDPAVCQMTKAQ
jgi:ABC-type Fe3+/spermidine/putrescine transport system ATPase subunit